MFLQSIFVVLASSALALGQEAPALPVPVPAPATVPVGPAPIPITQCNTGAPSCCSSTSTIADPATAALAGLLNIVIQDINVVLGIKCSPIGLGQAANCAQQPVCCENTQFNGLINIGCSPLSL